MDKIELKVMAWTGALLTLFLVSLMYAAASKNADVPECVPYSGAFNEPHFKKIDSLTYEAFYVAGMWNYEPNEVFIPAGSELDIYLTSKDVVHGFHIEKKAVNLMAVPGGIVRQTVKFTEPGIYKIVCHEYCGNGHQNMLAEIIVN